MPRYYLDIETVPLKWDPHTPNDRSIIGDPTKNKIITIQYQEIRFSDGMPKGDLQILKEWETSEEDIVTKFSKEFLPFDDVHNNFDKWKFVPVGNNLNFEWKHLTPKIKKYYGVDFDPLDKPTVDLKDTLVLINKGAFTGYHTVLAKNGRASNMAKWYYNEQYDEILRYIMAEAESFHLAHQVMSYNLPLLKDLIEQKVGTSNDTGGFV